jgi:DUF1680 family protein
MSDFTRRDFLAAGAAVTAGLLLNTRSPAAEAAAPALAAAKLKLQPFDYQGVKLLPSRWQAQFQSARDFYLNVSNDDILHAYRAAANLPAPGKNLGGWCERNSNTVFGQWLQGLSRMFKATADPAIRDKAVTLFTEWAKTLPADGNSRMGHYPFEKLVGGLVDLKQYIGHDDALPILEKVVDVAIATLDRTRTPAAPRPWELHSGRPGEWYTMGENHYRAFQLTGKAKYKDFADVWRYDSYWNKLADSAEPQDAFGVHAYSHVNTWSSCAMAYAVTGDPKLLAILKNAYDFLQNTQCYATGGYGPVERIMPSNGNLGLALESRQNSCEVPCCSWAAFKLARYLMTFTGEARYGDWIERLLYNGIGAALPITDNGKNFYYADYRVAGGIKNYARSTYTCCSGTYIQAVTEYHNLVYFQNPGSLFVNLYVPSEVTFSPGEGGANPILLTQETTFPESETSTFTITLPSAVGSARFAVNFRIPGWSSGASLTLNGAPANIDCKPGTWASLERDWKTGDKVEIRFPLAFRYQPVDKWHPDRVAVVRGPVVMVQDAAVHEPIFALPPTDADLNNQLVSSRAAGQFALRLSGKNAADPTSANSPANAQGGPQAGAKFMPFYAIPEVNSYRIYFDRRESPVALW